MPRELPETEDLTSCADVKHEEHERFVYSPEDILILACAEPTHPFFGD